MDLKDAELELTMFKFQTLFECFNQPDSKLTKSGINTRNALYELVRDLNSKIRTNTKTADEILDVLSKSNLNLGFASQDTGTLEDIKEYIEDMAPIKELKKEELTRLRNGINPDKPLETVQRILILHNFNVATVYQVTQELKELFKW